ncbi:MAG TPA: aspartate:alanine exchanger family transporter [Deinococcales bacterium]|nr:aspartate:alanine exchanger family transporter [Deinococcales bacterium]
MLDLLAQNSVLLLFVIAAIGYPIGRIKVGGFSLGISAVLFVGIAFNALRPDLKLPEFVYIFGLALFVYTIGLSSGPGFFAAFRRRGVRDNLFTVAMIAAAGLATAAMKGVFHLNAQLAAGLFAGSLTNAPGLAAVLETVKASLPLHEAASVTEKLLTDPVVAFSVTYPMGVIGMLVVIFALERFWKVNYHREAAETGSNEPIIRRSVFVSHPGPDASVASLARKHGHKVLFARVRREGQLILAGGDTRFRSGDVVSIIGNPGPVNAVLEELGETSDDALELDRSDLDFRRIFVSSTKVAGQTVGSLGLPQRFGAIVTRIRRGDVDLLATGGTVLELGDRVRVVAPRETMAELSHFFGDSYRALSEVDVLTFSVGLALGLLVGSLPLPLPGATFKLGYAGGPLVVSLILGALGRTGPVLWQIPYSANLTLRQLGIVLFLAGIGSRSGAAFLNTFHGTDGLFVFLGGIVVTCFMAFLALWVGYRFLKIPFALLTGMLAGMQTQPAVLAFASERAGNDLPNVGYASTYPMGTIAKIIGAQLVLMLLR